MPVDPRLNRFMAIHGRIRSRFPQIDRDIRGNRRIYLNSAAGTLVVDAAAKAMAEAATWLNSLPGEIYPSEEATKDFHWHIREIAADFLNAGSPDEISFHFSTTQALFNLAVSLRGLFTGQRDLIVTDLDHMANISPWEMVGGKWREGEVKRARIKEPGLLDTEHLLFLVTKNTALIAVPFASNSLGTVVPLQELVAGIKAKAPNCLICVDAVHHAMHGAIDVQKIDCDFLAFSGYKIFGPMLGVLWGRKELLDKMKPYRVETNKNLTPFKYEQGTLNNSALASLGAALQYLLWLDDELNPQDRLKKENRRAKFRRVMNDIACYESEMTGVILDKLSQLESSRVRFYGIVDPKSSSQRDPTFAFEIAGQKPSETKKLFWERQGIQIADGNHYSAVFCRHFRKDSVCRASFAHYNSVEEARAFLATLEELLTE
ncbi:MAG: aminotransferase class V-fold PLP-dependent enzyme [Clostridiales bacterium]|nr:aminotransferase class V-fold PLP-dependent enzyme [Clostridiales bacterium]